MENTPEPRKAAPLSEWVDDLACPVCFSVLRFGEESVECTGCSRVYPIVDGIPVLIPQRALSATSD